MIKKGKPGEEKTTNKKKSRSDEKRIVEEE